jgi:putative transposase
MTKPSPFRYFKTSPEIIRLAVLISGLVPVVAAQRRRSAARARHRHQPRDGALLVEPVGPMFAANIRKRRVKGMRSSNWRWHLDEVFVKINGERHSPWRAVDHEGEVFEIYVTKRRYKKAALEFLMKSMRRHGSAEVLVTDRLRFYGSAMKKIGNTERQETGRWVNNRSEKSHQPIRRRERAMLRFRRMRTLQKFAPVHASDHTLLNQECALYTRQTFELNRAAALAEWRGFLLPDDGAGRANRDWFAFV